MVRIRYCPNCEQNVGTITSPHLGEIFELVIAVPFFGTCLAIIVSPFLWFTAFTVFQFLLKVSAVLGVISLLFRRVRCSKCGAPRWALQHRKLDNDGGFLGE